MTNGLNGTIGGTARVKPVSALPNPMMVATGGALTQRAVALAPIIGRVVGFTVGAVQRRGLKTIKRQIRKPSKKKYKMKTKKSGSCYIMLCLQALQENPTNQTKPFLVLQ